MASPATAIPPSKSRSSTPRCNQYRWSLRRSAPTSGPARATPWPRPRGRQLRCDRSRGHPGDRQTRSTTPGPSYNRIDTGSSNPGCEDCSSSPRSEPSASAAAATVGLAITGAITPAIRRVPGGSPADAPVAPCEQQEERAGTRSFRCDRPEQCCPWRRRPRSAAPWARPLTTASASTQPEQEDQSVELGAVQQHQRPSSQGHSR